MPPELLRKTLSRKLDPAGEAQPCVVELTARRRPKVGQRLASGVVKSAEKLRTPRACSVFQM